MIHRCLLRWLVVCTAWGLGLGIWAAAADEGGAAGEPELETLWTAELTVASAPAGTPLPAPFTALRDAHGYSSFVSSGELTSDRFGLEGETVRVLALAVVGGGSQRSLELTLNVSAQQAP